MAIKSSHFTNLSLSLSDLSVLCFFSVFSILIGLNTVLTWNPGSLYSWRGSFQSCPQNSWPSAIHPHLRQRLSPTPHSHVNSTHPHWNPVLEQRKHVSSTHSNWCTELEGKNYVNSTQNSTPLLEKRKLCSGTSTNRHSFVAFSNKNKAQYNIL